MTRHIIDQPRKGAANRMAPYLMLDAGAGEGTHPTSRSLHMRRPAPDQSRRLRAFLDILRRSQGDGAFRPR
ncbi:hypothetical protein [Alkalilacustris brevis]|uniref:hypothetical protein n=1 Tax=Alkalilacustris brevis TaxID=2026338 RepID=UPI000E0D485D|nr:hypothetical protein [Alkalilacustris brevis]